MITTRGLKSSAITGLVAAIALLALSLASGLQASAVTGPGALAVTPRGEVWVGVDHELWRASGQGHLLHVQAAQALGLPGPPSNLVRHPDGRIVATVRGNPALLVLDRDTAQVQDAIMPRWPADLQSHGKDAINVAFAPDGRFAIAAGGGHAVALFDASGAFLARTAAGTYRFTNGLWWHDGDLWTTDTNRFALRRLDGRTLAVLQSATLPADDPARFLGPARAAGADDATAALIRYRNGMVQGRVAIVRPDGTETPLPGSADFEPVDVDWLGGQVLASDGASLTLRRWSEDGRAVSDFGDAAFARRLQQVGRTRGALWNRHTLALRGGIGVFVIALALALIARRRADAAPADTPRPDLARLDAPPAGGGSPPSRAQAAIASALVPGLGQWWQRRNAMGLLLFLPWAVLTLRFGIPLAWTMLGPRADVSTQHVSLVFGLQAGYVVLAACDAWRAGRPRADAPGA